MNILSGLRGDSSRQISELKDPFKKDCITGVMMHYFRTSGGNHHIHGYVEFKNGSTQGKQTFEADNFGDLIEKMKKFTETLS